MIPENTHFDDCMKKSRVIHVKSTSLYIANQYAAIYENSVVHDIREIAGGWREKDAVYKQLEFELSFARQKNQKHFIVTRHQLPAAIENLIDIIIRHEEGYVTFDYDVQHHPIYQSETHK